MEQDQKPAGQKRVNLAQDFATALAEGKSSLQKDHKSGELSLPSNPVTGKSFSGINAVTLMDKESHGKDPRWLTFEQANKAGLKVSKGSHSEAIYRYETFEKRPALDARGQQTYNQDGSEKHQIVKLEKPRLTVKGVFNATDIEGIRTLAKPAPSPEKDARAANLVKAYAAENPGFEAPDKTKFKTHRDYLAAGVDAVAQHQAGKLDRDPAVQKMQGLITGYLAKAELSLPHKGSQEKEFTQDMGKFLQQFPQVARQITAQASRDKDEMMVLSRSRAMGRDAGQDQQPEQGKAAEALKNRRETQVSLGQVR